LDTIKKNIIPPYFIKISYGRPMLWFLIHIAHANDLDFGFLPSLEMTEQPTFMLTPSADIQSVTVRIQAGSQTYSFDKYNQKSGVEMSFSWERNTTITSALVFVEATFIDGYVAQAEIPLEYEYGGGLDVDLSTAIADDTKNTVSFSVTGYVEYAEIIAYGAKKAVIERSNVQINKGPGKITVPWLGNPKDTVLLDVTLHGKNSYAGFTYSPWFLDIPHLDVLFDSASTAISDSEFWKLQSTLSDLQEVLVKYGSVIPIQLYIAGCTDTVGKKDYNSTLSEGRARSIATWLRKNGYQEPIFYYGFGESLLAEKTEDNVDNLQNRRALYIVSSSPPPISSGIPKASWKQLP
jgi:outer membrane protein OmpA-like peptidoglycan-associated protein